MTNNLNSAHNGVRWLAAPGWDRFPWLMHGFSTRQGGVSRAYAADGAPGELNLGFTPDDDRENVLRNRELFAEAVSGATSTPLVTLHQVHSSIVVNAAAVLPSQPACQGDGILTQQPGILVGVQTADCVPVLIVDPKRKAVAAIHAGWRGTVKRIVENGIDRMRLEFGSHPDDLIAAIGPAIGPCCYSVGEEVRSEFESQFSYANQLFHQVDSSDSAVRPALHLDLFEANRRQLLAAGLKPEAIQCVGGCTACQPRMFFSHRASQGKAGRMLSVVGIRNQ